jgi:hypothetical protein
VTLALFLDGRAILSPLRDDFFHPVFDVVSAVTWSPRGRFLSVVDKVYEVGHSAPVIVYRNGPGQWSHKAEVRASVGRCLVLWNAVTEERRGMFEASSSEEIVPLVAWDSRGYSYAFATGRRESGELFFEKVHVMDGQLYHYIENEHNLQSTQWIVS